ncbi:MAG TPA: 5-methyltetrahydropteroyltriglutamate--homocysteine S-methyltransferase [Candidatus Dormibacteraeota bacterium]|nr:5-methyltetrahydropteroyltriglutamate--homocysteine S-methyltransferase [Candidatus Dormibacteraeota bacterium]
MATASARPPFPAEHVGSLLRPPELLEARAAFEAGRIPIEELRAVEDRHILEAIRFQERVGLRSVTDGEFRRAIYFGHFPAAVEGFTWMDARDTFTDARGRRMRYRTPVVTGRLRRVRGIATEEYRFVAERTARTPKVTLPSPCSQHYFRWREGVSDRDYDLEAFFTDLTHVYREELAALGALGAGYVQLDDVSFGMLSDERHRREFRARGYDLEAMVDRYVDLINQAIAGRPEGMVVALHVCRGNNQGRWLAEGGYDALAERVFGQLQVDALFLEYDSPRAGGFAPLRFVPRRQRVVLGLVSTKTPALEPEERLLRAIEEAGRHFPVERMALSPQCGFASTAPGNPLTPADQEAKLRRVVEVAARVWGG